MLTIFISGENILTYVEGRENVLSDAISLDGVFTAKTSGDSACIQGASWAMRASWFSTREVLVCSESCWMRKLFSTMQ